MKKTVVILFIFFVSSAVMLTQSKAAEEKGQSLFEKKCGICHSISRAKSKRKTKEQWKSTVLRMKSRNRAPISDREASAIINYLAENYGK